MDLKEVVQKLQEYAPLHTACDWDNVGLLTEPTEPLQVKKILVTNDLTEPVLEEAIANNVNMIIAYHPAIFKPLKRLTQSEWKQRSIVKCIEKRIAVFSPHTTWDSIDGLKIYFHFYPKNYKFLNEGGINDWILQSFDCVNVESVGKNVSNKYPSGFEKTVKLNIESENLREILLKKVENQLTEPVHFLSEKQVMGPNSIKLYELEFLTTKQGVVFLLELINQLNESTNIINTFRIIDNDRPLMKNVGLGRVAKLKEPVQIRDIVERMKKKLEMKTFRLALGNGKTLDSQISTIAIGAGGCSKLLNNTSAEFIITGEFTHHEILHEVHRGVSVIVTDHSNTERGFIDQFIKDFNSLLSKENKSIEILRSKLDRDPLEYI